MKVYTKVKLTQFPKNPKVITFESSHTNPEKKYYPRFFVTKYSQIQSDWQKDRTYRIELTGDREKDKVGNVYDTTRWFLNSVKLTNKEPDENDLGKAILLGVTIKEIVDDKVVVGKTVYDSDIEIVRKIKVADETTSLWVWEYGAKEETSFKKGDKVDMVVRLMNKTNMLPDGTIETYNNRPVYYTELEFIKIENVVG